MPSRVLRLHGVPGRPKKRRRDMQFPYQCQKCEKRFDADYPIGKAPRVVPCPSCGGDGKRIYEGMNVTVKTDGAFHRTSNFGEQMKHRNEKAGQRMRGKKPGMRLAAYDYGHGDIREVKRPR